MRELVVLGTSSALPTRTRNHNGYLLRWDRLGLLFDPGEGTQRQMLHAGVSSPSITHLCVTHAHGDHCLGIPGVVQRMGMDAVRRELPLFHPAPAADEIGALLAATAYVPLVPVQRRPVPVDGDGPVTVAAGEDWTLSARPLDHRVPAVGYRLTEPDGRRMRPDLLERHGLAGPDVGRLIAAGELRTPSGTVRVEDVSVPRSGQVFAFVMDTRRCENAVALAAGADLLVCESTYLDADHALAEEYGHLTARQAGELARAAGARRLVLTHFSQRYGDDARPFLAEAAAVFPDVVAAEDLMRVPVPARRG